MCVYIYIYICNYMTLRYIHFLAQVFVLFGEYADAILCFRITLEI